MKRSRGRGRNRPQNNHNRNFDSAGPDIKIRGTAAHVYEKYLQLARDAGSQGDRVMAENYLQHAEHYYRIMMASLPQGGQMQQGQYQQGQYQGQGQGQPGQPMQNGQQHGNGGGMHNQHQQQHPNGGNENYVPGGSGPSFGFADDADEGDDLDGNIVR